MRISILASTLALAPVLSLAAWAAPVADSHVVMLLLDGCRADAVQELLSQGKLPNIKRHLLERGLRVETCVTVFPSTTGPAYAPFVTGLLPKSSGIAGIRWYDRTTGRSTVYAGREFGRINGDLAPGFKTIYELLPDESLSVFGFVDRGCNRRLMPILDLSLNKIFGQYQKMDRGLHGVFMKEALGKTKVPRYMFLSYHAPDSVGHAQGVEDPAYREGIVQIDGFVGEIARRLQELGLYDKSYWVLSADHGQSSATEHLSLAQWLSENHGLEVRDSKTRETGIHNLRAGSHRSGNDIHVEVSGNACVMFYLAPAGADPSKPVFSSTVRAFPARSGETVDVEEALLQAPAVELVLTRNAPDVYRIRASAGAAELTRSPAGLAYRVVSGTDPLGYSAHPVAGKLAGGQPATADRWFEATAQTAFPDAPLQISQLLDSPRAGDVIITAKPGWEPWTEGQAGLHGGLRREHMCVPLLLAGPGVRTGTLPRARTIDVFPTVLEMLGLPAQPGIDGRAIPWQSPPSVGHASE